MEGLVDGSPVVFRHQDGITVFPGDGDGFPFDVGLGHEGVEFRTCFSDADLRGAHLKGIKGFMEANWLGADIRNVDFCGAYMVRRFIMDENFLYEFRTQSRFSGVLYKVWWITSDCGRSFLRWGLWTAGVAFFFALIFSLLEVDYGDHPTTFSPLYYSFVTLTTLGYGDVVPASSAAQIVSVVEVIVGYVALGGLLSIFATKMARRAE